MYAADDVRWQNFTFYRQNLHMRPHLLDPPPPDCRTSFMDALSAKISLMKVYLLMTLQASKAVLFHEQSMNFFALSVRKIFRLQD